MRYLTKSRFKLAVECPRKLFYTGKDHEYRNVKGDDPFLQQLANGGFQVGELAKKLYPDGIEITARSSAQALAETAELLSQENVTIFEAALAFDAFLVRVDVLVKTGNRVKLVEVKSTSQSSEDPEIVGKKGKLTSKFRPYVEDIAFQRFVAASAFPQWRVSGYLMVVDKSKRAAMDQMNQLFKVHRDGRETKVIVDPRADALTYENSLLWEFNADPYIEMVMQEGLTFPSGAGDMAQMAKQWAEAYAEDRPIYPPIGAQCAKCEFKSSLGSELKSGFHECWKEANHWIDSDFSDPLVTDLWNYKSKHKLMEKGVRKLSEVTQEDLNYVEGIDGLTNSQRQWMQVDGLPVEHKSAGYYLDSDYMAMEMDSWRYPLHFIDFETSTVPLPFHVGMRPYEQVAFQFSHHIMDEDGALRHATEFLLAEPGCFPNFEFARALKAALGQDHGTVFRWADHENTVLNKIIEQLETRDDAPDDREELAAFLKTLTKGQERAMVNLCDVAKKSYFHASTKASCSLKKVLPAVLESSTFLKERYSQPLYGTPNAIPSRNFQNMTWWQQDEIGAVIDPYQLLLGPDAAGLASMDMDEEDLDVAEGGAAATAYSRLQFEDLHPEVRQSIEAKLLRYCELDTLAMAMVVEAWREAL